MKQRNLLWEYTEIIVCALGLALLVQAFLVKPYRIPSGSMLDTLKPGDFLFVTRFTYGVKIPFIGKEVVSFSDPQRGDIIVFKYPEDTSVDYIKRIVGVPGDVLAIRNKQLFRNGVRVTDEPYARHSNSFSADPRRDSMPPVTVPPDKYFVMGDNRDDSMDSRFWGFVPRENIQGKAWVIYWSWEIPGIARWDNIHTWITDMVIRWNRMGTWIR